MEWKNKYLIVHIYYWVLKLRQELQRSNILQPKTNKKFQSGERVENLSFTRVLSVGFGLGIWGLEALCF